MFINYIIVFTDDINIIIQLKHLFKCFTTYKNTQLTVKHLFIMTNIKFEIYQEDQGFMTGSL